MAQSWKNFEDHVRKTAQFIWDRPVEPEHIAGVNIDGVAYLNRTQCILLEITEERTLTNVRDDIIKLETARNALWNEKKGIITLTKQAR
jgi:hypothetical protein